SPGPGRRVGSLRPRLDHIASRHRANPVVTLRWNDDAEDILTAARRAVVAGDEREIHEATCVLAADAVELRAATRVAAGARGRAERGDRGGGIRRIHADRAHAAVRPDVARVGGGRPPAQVRPHVEIERDYDAVGGEDLAEAGDAHAPWRRGWWRRRGRRLGAAAHVALGAGQ